jgi:arsenate reductase
VEGSEVEVDAAFEETWRLLDMRVRAFLDLDLAALDRASTSNELARIGQMEGAA